MPLDATDTPDQADQPSGREFMGRFLRVSLRYWREDAARQAWLLTGAVLVLVLLTLANQIAINSWNRFFFDALDTKNAQSILLGVGIIAGLAVAAAAIAVVMVHMR